jgi:tight adherence protein B
MVPLLTALTFGAFAFTITLWVTRFAAIPLPSERLARLNRNAPAEATSEKGTSLRRRANVSFGGINLVSANLVAKWNIQLERAGLTINAREYLVMRVVAGVAAMAIVFFLIPMPLVSLLAAPLGFLAVGFWVKLRVGSRRRKLELQLVELLQMVASGLRAGFGLLQALESSSEQLPSPLSVEIRRTMRDTAMGASVDQALQGLNERVGSPDFDIVITAILIQRSVGGNLAEILDNVANTMRERERIRGEIRTLTSQQRMTGFVIGGIPIGLGGVFMLIAPEFMMLLFTETLGHYLLGAAVLMEGIGFFIISRIVNIEV